MSANNRKPNPPSAICRGILLLALSLVGADLFFAVPSPAFVLSPWIPGETQLLFRYSHDSMIHDVYFDLSVPFEHSEVSMQGGAPQQPKSEADETPAYIQVTEDRALMIHLFRLGWEHQDRLQPRFVFGMKAIPRIPSRIVDAPWNPASFDAVQETDLTESLSSHIFERLKETVLMIQFTIRY